MLHLRTACAIVALLLAAPAAAAPITWSEPVRITTAEQTLALPARTLQAAAQFGSPNDVDVTLANKKTIRFVAVSFDDGKSPVADLSKASKRFASMFAFTGSGNDAFDRVLSGGAVEGRDSSGILSLRGLTPGKRYTVQLFAIDMRGATVAAATSPIAAAARSISATAKATFPGGSSRAAAATCWAASWPIARPRPSSCAAGRSTPRAARPGPSTPW